jgi:UDP-N-acetylglucosamine--N-acetylmuramyl-(pentapeptide) pyrophosphoryl-undecaprenol N-acetylglucosamine transferase
MKERRVIIAGGGTGGHVYPALNIAEELRRRWSAEILFLGTRRGMEARLVPDHGFEIDYLPVQGFDRRYTLKNLKTIWNLMLSLEQGRQVLKSFKPDLVIGTGGFVMGPVLWTAQRMGIPTVIQEQNSYPGLTTRLLAGKAKVVFAAFSEIRRYLPHQAKVLRTGNPINRVKVQPELKPEICTAFGLKPNRFILLVFGGSQGAQSINKTTARLIEENYLPEDIQLLWQTGFKDAEFYKQRFAADERIHVVPFISRMNQAYAVADLAMCRSGAMTISELIAAGLPAILIPYPFAADNHQFKNAKNLAEQKAALVIRDNDGVFDNVSAALGLLIENPDRRKSMAAAMAALDVPDTMERIMETLDEIMESRI